MSGKSVFEDIFGPERAPEVELRYQLMEKIGAIIEHHQYSQAELIKILDQKQPHVSSLMNGKIGEFSSDRLSGFLARLGAHVEIVCDIPPKKTAVR
jgi:predicted XRE-type DNA-binding protein